MGHGNPYKGDGTGKGGDAGGQHAGQENQGDAEQPDVDAEILRICLAQLVGAHGLGKQKCA